MDYRDNAIEAIRKALAEQKLAEPCPCGKQTMAWCFANTCSKAEQPAKQPKLSDYEPDGMHHNKPHKCKYPKCSYPCLDLPDCRDAEQPAILLGEVRGLQWDKTSQAFNDWWDSDYDPTGNPFRQDSAAYWAWAGWKAAIEQAEQAQPYADKAAMFAHMKDRIRIDPVTGNVGIGTPQQPEQEQPRISAGPITPAMQAGPTEAQKQQLAAFAKSMQAQPVAIFDENLGRPKMFADAPMLKHGQTLYTAPPPRQPEQAQPVGSVFISKFRGHLENFEFDYWGELPVGTHNLYTAPPPRQPWAGLTDAEWMNIVNKDHAWFGHRPEDVAHEVAKLVEAKLKEKNA